MKNRMNLIPQLTLAAVLAVTIQACEKSAPPAGGEEPQAAAAVAESAESEEHEAEMISLSEEQVRLAEIVTVPAALGDFVEEIRLPGEVQYNQNRLVHITPRVEGIVTEVRKSIGDRVNAGDLLAVLESRELAESKAKFQAAGQRLVLARELFDLEKKLWDQKISAEQDYLNARQKYNEVRIEFSVAEKQLHALGLAESEVKGLASDRDVDLARYEIRVPFAGTIVEWHISKGERVGADSALYTVADLDALWVIANVYEPDIARIRPGQVAAISVKAYPEQQFRATVTWISSAVDEQTRTLPIRIEVDDPGRRLKRGMFADVALGVETTRNVLTIPIEALRLRKNEPIVFVAREAGRFEPREVAIGRRSTTQVEIKEGLSMGERIVTGGSFILLSELEKGGLDAGH